MNISIAPNSAAARMMTTLALLLSVLSLTADPVVGPWTPKFKGIDFSVSTNLPTGGDFTHHQVVYALRVDLADPDIALLTTPRITNYFASVREVGGLTVSGFLLTNRVQAAINANFFDARNYYLPAGTPMDVYGLAISRGEVVSTQDESEHASVILFNQTNQATLIPTNLPPVSTAGVFTAVAGNYPLVVAGKNIISRAAARELDPRTLFGLSEDRRYLYLVAIDGRQPGYSDGANDYESAGWLLLLGAYDGINMDGGGSTTMVVQDSTGAAVRLNQSSAVADSGRERTVGSHLGIYAKPLLGFINDVAIAAEDTSARVSWTTTGSASSEVRYGLTPDLGSSSGIDPTPATNHVVQLAGLSPKTSYYLQVLSATDSQEYASSTFLFTTTNYVTTSQVFGLDQPWTFQPAPLAGSDWTSPAYDDSSWSSGPGLLWVDVRATGPNPDVNPRTTVMPADPATGYPYITYDFRTHVILSNVVSGTSLHVQAYIDDGAVVYLNGVEAYRLRMPPVSTASTLALGYPCDGDATCVDEFTLEGAALNPLHEGDNVLAVEVHNYNARSADTTFGLSLSRSDPLARDATLQASYAGDQLTLSWDQPGYSLQSSTSLAGPWYDTGASSPVTVSTSDSEHYYRLKR